MVNRLLGRDKRGPSRGGGRGARALPKRPAAQGAATGLCLFQSAVRISPAVRDAGSIAHLVRLLRNHPGKISQFIFLTISAKAIAGLPPP